MGFHQKAFGSLNAAFSITDRYEGTDRKALSLSYSRLLFGNVWLRVTASRREADNNIVHEVFSGLDFALGKTSTGNLRYHNQSGRSDLSAGVYKYPPRGIGSRYRFSLEGRENRHKDWRTRGDALFQYSGPFGIYKAEYRRSWDQNSYDLRMSGAMAFIGDSLHLSRPISDSFALVRVGDIEGVKVRHSNQEVGKTNEKGELIVPNLISYHDNKISLEPTDIPLEYDIRETSKYVSVPYRGGGITDFGITKVQAVEGRIFFRENGEKIPAEYIGLELKVEGRSIESVVGEHGTFYLENLSPGTFPARIFSEDRECRFEMVIPEMRGAVVNLGDIICEVREDIRTYSADGPGS
ncbi:MAG: hypothetical protein DRI57_31985 [Deltaproteobacteria bacterium]|nr:MAG: hypothetical protein DRI57_31985 [Deltaproteobacteria bacterium]